MEKISLDCLNEQDLKIVMKLYDEHQLDLDDGTIDDLLGLQIKKQESLINTHALKELFGVEQFIYEGTPYEMIREFIQELNPKEGEIVYDLGAGYGRVILYGALTTNAKFVGAEIVPERAHPCQQIIKKWNIRNASMFQVNVLDLDLSNGNTFFLFNPFYLETLERVGEQLKSIAKTQKIKIATWGGTSNEYFLNCKWLAERKMSNPDSKYQFFTSSISA